MSVATPKLCPHCSAPLQNQTTSSRGFTKASYECGTVVGYFRQQVVPVRSADCRQRQAKVTQARTR